MPGPYCSCTRSTPARFGEHSRGIAAVSATISQSERATLRSHAAATATPAPLRGAVHPSTHRARAYSAQYRARHSGQTGPRGASRARLTRAAPRCLASRATRAVPRAAKLTAPAVRTGRSRPRLRQDARCSLRFLRRAAGRIEVSPGSWKRGMNGARNGGGQRNKDGAPRGTDVCEPHDGAVWTAYGAALLCDGVNGAARGYLIWETALVNAGTVGCSQ